MRAVDAELRLKEARAEQQAAEHHAMELAEALAASARCAAEAAADAQEKLTLEVQRAAVERTRLQVGPLLMTSDLTFLASLCKCVCTLYPLNVYAYCILWFDKFLARTVLQVHAAASPCPSILIFLLMALVQLNTSLPSSYVP